jgi:hypothetical protein
MGNDFSQPMGFASKSIRYLFHPCRNRPHDLLGRLRHVRMKSLSSDDIGLLTMTVVNLA